MPERRLEAAQHAALANTRQAGCGSANPASGLGAEIDEIEQPADLAARGSRR